MSPQTGSLAQLLEFRSEALRVKGFCCFLNFSMLSTTGQFSVVFVCLVGWFLVLCCWFIHCLPLYVSGRSPRRKNYICPFPTNLELPNQETTHPLTSTHGAAMGNERKTRGTSMGFELVHTPKLANKSLQTFERCYPTPLPPNQSQSEREAF